MKVPKPGEFVFDPELKQEVTVVPLDTVRRWSNSLDVCQHCTYLRTTLCVERSCVDVIYFTKNDYLTAKMLGML